MNELFEDILTDSGIKVSNKIYEENHSTYFTDGGIYYVYIDNDNKFNIVPLNISTDITEERIKILHPNIKIKYSFLIRFISDKTFRYIYTEESTLEILDEIKNLIRIKEDSTFNIIQSTCNSKHILDRFFIEMNLELDGYAFIQENIMRIKDIIRNIKSDNKESNLYYSKFIPIYNNINYKNELIKKDIVIRNPYESYEHVTDFINQMCLSEDIKTIFCTLYRTAKESVIVESLIKAKKSNKSIYVYVEPNARGDEKQNVFLIERLLKNKIHVSCNYYTYKVHSKLFCAIDNSGIIYAHIGTGNYNENNARIYTDLNLLTTNPTITSQVVKMFMCILKKKIFFPDDSIVKKKLFSSPINLREEIISRIDGEIRKGNNGRIYIKCNSLCDLQVIDRLYKASLVGVSIKIISRTAISMLPINKNIQIRSKVGRFLEHDRIYIFGNDLYISSADLLLRNINKRVEILCQITDENCKMKVYNIFNEVWNSEDIYYIGKDYLWHKLKSIGV
jgi:polyphosphate kinase 1